MIGNSKALLWEYACHGKLPVYSKESDGGKGKTAEDCVIFFESLMLGPDD
jgi:hypothetical protein